MFSFEALIRDIRFQYARSIRQAVFLTAAAAVFPLSVSAQNGALTTQNGCPVELLKLKPSGVALRIRNTSGKKIVGLVFNVAVADATEHWKWLYKDDGRSIRDFGWNKQIKDGEEKNLVWPGANINFYHGGGGVLVLTSALFEDGSSWEEPKDSATCKSVWYNSHKKSFLHPVVLPVRE